MLQPVDRGAPRAATRPGDVLWDPSWAAGEGEQTIWERSEVQRDTAAVFFCSWFCPFAQRVWIALEEKGADYRYVEINPYAVDPSRPGGYTKEQLPLEAKAALYPDFVRASPRGLVPALRAGDEELCESSWLIEYVDAKFPSADGAAPSLMPSDPYLRARDRIWAERADAKVQRPYYRLLMDTEAGDGERRRQHEAFLAGCREFARAMAPAEEGPFFRGPAFGYVDCSFAPFWQRILWVGSHYRDLRLPDGAEDPDFARLELWWAAVSRRPSVARTLVSRPRLVQSYADYASNRATSDYARGMVGTLSSATRLASPLSAVTGELRRTPWAAVASAAAFGFAAGIAAGRSSVLSKV